MKTIEELRQEVKNAELIMVTARSHYDYWRHELTDANQKYYAAVKAMAERNEDNGKADLPGRCTAAEGPQAAAQEVPERQVPEAIDIQQSGREAA